MAFHALIADKLLQLVSSSPNYFEVEFGDNVVFRSGAGSWSLGGDAGAGVRGLGCEVGGNLADGEGVGEGFRAAVPKLAIGHYEVLGGGLRQGDDGARKFYTESVGRGQVREGGAGVGADRRAGEFLRDGVRGVVGVGGGEKETVESVGVAAAVSEKTLANRAKRHRRRDAKIRKKKAAAASGSGNAGGVEAVVGVEAEDVPEWRRRQATRVGGSVGPKGGFFAEASEETRRRLRGTRAERLAAENELAAFKAKRQLVLEKAKDVAKMVKSQETRLLRDTERNKVQIEKAFLSLAKTGNVPGIGGSVSGGGSAKTVVSGSPSSNLASGTISPNSSVSMKEVHDMQKELETLKLERVQHLELMEKAGVKVPEKSRSMSTGWTTDGNGYFAAHHLAEGYDHLPDAYMVCRDGRIHANYWGEHDFDHYEG